MSETNVPSWKCPDCGRCECSKADLEDYDEEGLAAWRDAVQVCNDTERKNLRAEIAALREASRWIPVGERLPKKLGNVEIWRKMKDGTLVPGVAFVIAGSGWWVDTSGGRWSPGEVTHWRHMPAPPEPQAVPSQGGEVENG